MVVYALIRTRSNVVYARNFCIIWGDKSRWCYFAHETIRGGIRCKPHIPISSIGDQPWPQCHLDGILDDWYCTTRLRFCRQNNREKHSDKFYAKLFIGFEKTSFSHQQPVITMNRQCCETCPSMRLLKKITKLYYKYTINSYMYKDCWKTSGKIAKSEKLLKTDA